MLLVVARFKFDDCRSGSLAQDPKGERVWFSPDKYGQRALEHKSAVGHGNDPGSKASKGSYPTILYLTIEVVHIPRLVGVPRPYTVS